MALTPHEFGLWIVSTVLQMALCGLILRRHLSRHLPIFAAYAWLNLLTLALVWWAYLRHGYRSPAFFYIAWAAFGAALFARGLVVGELCRRVLRPYTGVWALAWRILTGVALLLVVYAGLAAYSSRDPLQVFLFTAERGLELAAAVIIILLLGISTYFDIRVDRLNRLLVLGLGTWSLLQVVNNVALLLWRDYLHWGSTVKIIAFQVSLIIWIVALLKPIPEKEPARPLLPQQVYDELAPQTNLKLRLLNDRLLEIFKG